MNSLRVKMEEIEEQRYIARFPFGASINPDGAEFSLIEVESLQAAPQGSLHFARFVPAFPATVIPRARYPRVK